MDNLDRIYSTLRHELGNSVNSLTITLEVLLKNFEYFNDDTKKEFISKSLDQVTRQYKILECLRIYQSADINEMARVELPQLLAEWIDSLKGKGPNGKIKIHQQLNYHELMIQADRESLLTSLNAIVDNARETLAGKNNPEVIISCSRIKDQAEIVIVDNGKGMDTDTLNKAVVPLFTTKENHMGLGLSLAMKRILKMGGELKVASETLKGTSVTLTFPVCA